MSELRASAPGELSNRRTVSADILFNSPGSIVNIDDLAIGDVIERIWVQVITAFNAGTTNEVTVGDGTTGNKYIANADVTEATPAVYPTGGKGPFVAETAAGTLRATYTQSGSPANAGRARVYAAILNLPL